MPVSKQYVVFRASVTGPAGRTTLVVERPFRHASDAEFLEWALARHLSEPLRAAEREGWRSAETELAADVVKRVEERLVREAAEKAEGPREADVAAQFAAKIGLKREGEDKSGSRERAAS